MHPQIESIFDEAENRYLNADELEVLTQYVDSLPHRLETYRQVRDQELAIMQQVADNLQVVLPKAKTSSVERSIKNALLVLRYCAMAMLLNDESFVKEHLLTWLKGIVSNSDTREIDVTLYQLLEQQLVQTLGDQQMTHLRPLIEMAKNVLLNPTPLST